MSTRLIQVVSFANVASGATVALPHNININDIAKKPDFVTSDTAGFSIVVTDVQVSVTNNNPAVASINVWLELKHSIPRELGAVANLTPQPFVAGTGGAAIPAGGPTNPSTTATYNEDFISLDAVTVVTTGGGTATLQEDAISTFVGDVQLQSAASGDAVAVNTSDSKLFMDLGTAGAPTTFIGRLQPPFGPPTALADFDIVFGMAQPLTPTGNIPNNGTYFRAGFASTGNANWWAVDTHWGLLVDTGVPVNTGGAPQTLKIVYTPGVDEKYFINDVLVASGVIGNGGIAVGLTALWHDISRNGDSYHVDYLFFDKTIAR